MSDLKYENEDWARLSASYTEDAALFKVCNEIHSAHGKKYAHLPMLYWPIMVVCAKRAKSFGWFRTLPSQLAEKARDSSPWLVREFMFTRMAVKLIDLRDELSDHDEVNIFMRGHKSWQSMSSSERTKLQRARESAKAGESFPWICSHLVEVGRAGTSRDDSREAGTTQDNNKTRQDKVLIESTTSTTVPPAPIVDVVVDNLKKSNPLVDRMVEVGVKPKVAEELAEADPEEVDRQLAALADRKNLSSRPATLITSIRQKWAVPPKSLGNTMITPAGGYKAKCAECDDRGFVLSREVGDSSSVQCPACSVSVSA